MWEVHYYKHHATMPSLSLPSLQHPTHEKQNKPTHPTPSTHLRVDREAAVELLPGFGRQPLRELLLQHDHGAAEHGPGWGG